MEVAGFTLGVIGAVGILGQIFDGCMTGYRVFSTAKNLGKDSEKLICKVKIEEMRLAVWGREWGVVEGKFEAHLTAIAWDGLKEIARDILSQLLATILDCQKLQEKYGLREEVPGSVDTAAYSELRKAVEPNTSFQKLKKDMRLRAKWVVSDKEKFETFLCDLEYFNDRLEKLFPPSRVATFQRTWTNELLETAQRNLGDLSLLEMTAAGRYPGLNTMAQLKQLRINLDAQQPSRQILSLSKVKIQRWRVNVSAEERLESQRVKAIYQKPLDELKGDSVSEDVPVLIEWVQYDAEMEMDGRLQLYQRVDNLVRMLHSSSNRHPDLHTLDTVGYTEDSANNRLGIIHLQPLAPNQHGTTAAPEFETLSALVEDSNKRTPDLDVRFKLAHTLAIALWSLHSLDWLHKSFSSLNIIFFSSGRSKSSSEQHDLQCPYVAGFDSSRPDGLTEMTVDPKFSNGEDLYRHPNSLGVWRQSYRKSFDIYSLGLVLLEIGLWKSIRIMHKPKYSSAVFRDKVIHALVPSLGSRVGSTFKTIVERCLTYDEWGETQKITPHQLMEGVVFALESLRV
jgi:hypothetical protein